MRKTNVIILFLLQVLQVFPWKTSPEPGVDGPEQECICPVGSPRKELWKMPISGRMSSLSLSLKLSCFFYMKRVIPVSGRMSSLSLSLYLSCYFNMKRALTNVSIG